MSRKISNYENFARSSSDHNRRRYTVERTESSISNVSSKIENGQFFDAFLSVLKWMTAVFLFAVVVFCTVTSKISLLVIGQQFKSFNQTKTSVSKEVSAETSKQALILMLVLVLMIPQAVAFVYATWTSLRRKSRPWPTKQGFILILIGGFLETLSLCFITIVGLTVLPINPSAIVLLMCSLPVVPAIWQAIKTRSRCNTMSGKLHVFKFATFAIIAVLGIALLSWKRVSKLFKLFKDLIMIFIGCQAKIMFGAHLTLKDERWALAVESCIKKFGWAFCCHDNHDQQVLKQLFSQVCRDNIPTIIVSRFQDHVHDVSANKPRSEFPTVLDMLLIDNPVVTNCLIDQVAIESVLLIEDPKVARQVMFQNPPAKARMAYAMNGDQLLGGKTARSYASMMDKARYLQKDIEVEIRQLEQEIEHKRQHQQQCQRDLDDVDRTIRDNTTELKKAKQKAFREQEAVNKFLGEITELENYEEEDLPDVTTLEEEVEHYTQQLEDLEQQTTVVEEEAEKAQDELSKQQLKETQHREKIQSLLEKADPFRNQQHEIEVQIETQKSHRKHFETRLRELQDSIRKAEREHEAMKKLVRVKTEQASQFCERVATRRTVKSLETEIIQKTKRIQTEERNKGKHEDITREYFEAKKRYEGIMESLKNLKKYSKRLRKVMEDRAKAFVNYRHFIAIRAKFFFQMMLSQRGYNGKMVFDHGSEILGLQVNVEQGIKRVAKDTRSLSGGERSFSTVSFIMALWEAMESPFRCLDEFDVFMDMVNRRISMEMMLKVAKEQQERQFILLTPQDMSAIGSSRSVRIFRLRDPERGQTTLNFQPPEA
ncbi:structural maintenance of chromosomes protein 6-like [Oculina patagonica]